MKKIFLLLIVLVLIILPQQLSVYAQNILPARLLTANSWTSRPYDLVYTVAFSSEQQPDGPLVVYRSQGTDPRNSIPIIAIPRGPLPLTPLFFPSPDGHYLALLMPLRTGSTTNLNGSALYILSTDGNKLAYTGRHTPFQVGEQNVAASLSNAILLAGSVATGDQIIWSANSRALFYHSGSQQRALLPLSLQSGSRKDRSYLSESTSYDEIHRVDFSGQNTLLLRQPQNNNSLRLIGLDRKGALVLTIARPHEPVALVRLATNNTCREDTNTSLWSPCALHFLQVITTLPVDILPGNVLSVRTDGNSVECVRVLSWHPFTSTLISISFTGAILPHMAPLFDTTRFGRATNALARSTDGHVLVMSQVENVRTDLAAQGIPNVPAQESLVLADIRTGAVQHLKLPYGGQIVQAFWTSNTPRERLSEVPASTLLELLAFHKRLSTGSTKNASVNQQDEWMLEGHAARLIDAPVLPKMCYGNCPQGFTGAPHVSAAILHGVAFVESNWHQFNSIDYRVNGEAVGTPVESFDGGWGQYQQTWGMPPQCHTINNCRSDVFKIQYNQSYNIGVGVQSLINAWNGSAGVTSSTDPNDPYKANHWFFAVWAYNGAYGNNPNDVPSSEYGHWYPGAPFRTIYEEYVWYFAAHPQNSTSGWTDNYLPSLGSGLLPPQSDFLNTSDSFVACVTCTISDWTSGSYDRNWVGVGTSNTLISGYFQTSYIQAGGEDILGLPRDNGGGAATHRWGNGWAQDFGGGSDLPGALLLLDGTTTPYWVYGGVWTQYLTIDRGVQGCHGYPISALSPIADSSLGPDNYLRQEFQSGSIIWDATTGIVAADTCS